MECCAPKILPYLPDGARIIIVITAKPPQGTSDDGIATAAFNTTNASAPVVPFNTLGKLKYWLLVGLNRTTGRPFNTPAIHNGCWLPVGCVALFPFPL